jgi:Lipocalin-like domain
MLQHNDIVGAWELMSYTERELPDGPMTYPHGPDAVGLIMYTPDGYMSAQIMTRGRPAYDRPTAGGGTTAQTAAAATGYLAYSGPYSVDEATGDIHHQVTVSLLPNWLRHTQIRHSQLRGDQLTLSAETLLPHGATVRSTLLWSRASVHSQ